MHSPNVRESRHVIVTGLPESTSTQEIDNFFSSFGKLEKEAVRCGEAIIVSFRDIRSAQKALQSDDRLRNIDYRMSYHEANTAVKNPISNSCMANRSSASPKAQDGPLARRRSVSPWREKFDQMQLEKNLKSRTKRPINNSITSRNQRREGRSSSSPTNPPEGLQGYYIEKLPRNIELTTLKRQLTDQFKVYGTIADITFEDINGNHLRALLLYNEVKQAPEKYEMFLTTRCRVRQAEPVDVQIAYSKTVARRAGIAISLARERDLPPNLQEEFTVFSDRASRTLYVGGLDPNPTEQALRRRFDRFGFILEVDVKNPESPAPFAFIHFVDLESTVKAVNHHLQHGAPPSQGFMKKPTRVNFGRTPVSNKLWLGCLPPNAPEDVIRAKLKAMFEGATDILYDKASHQALVRFDSAENAQKGHTGVRSQTIELEHDDQTFRLSVDYGTESLLSHFRDRLGKGGNYLSPPPNPPADMPGYSRYDERKSSSRRRSRSRDRRRSRSGSRRRQRRRSTRRRTRSTSEDSSNSSGPSSSGSARSSSPARSQSPPQRYKHSLSKKRSEADYGNHHSSGMDRSPRRSYSKERRKSVPSGPKHSDAHHHPPPTTAAGDRAASGDSGYRFEEPRQLEPPPAPPPLALPPVQPKASPPPAPPSGPPPPLNKPPPPQGQTNFGHHPQPPPRSQPQPLMAQPVAPPPALMNLPPTMKPHRPRVEEHHPHVPHPGPSNEQHPKQRPPERKEEGRLERKESILRPPHLNPEHHPERPKEERPRPPMPPQERPPHGQEKRPPHEQERRSLNEHERRPTHDQLVKKPSVDGAHHNPPPPAKHIPKNPREHGLRDPRVYRKDYCPRPELKEFGRFHCYYGRWEIRSHPVLEARRLQKEPSTQTDSEHVQPEMRKRSSGSVHSVDNNKSSDVRRASGGNVARGEGHDDHGNPFHTFPSFGQLPTPTAPTPTQAVPPTPPFNAEEAARLKQRSESAPNWQNQKSLEPQTPQTPAPFSAGPGTSGPGLISGRTGSISFEDRLTKLRKLGSETKHTPIKLGLNPINAQQFGMAMSGGNLPPPPVPSSSRPNLHITIPAAGTSFPTTPNSAKSDFSPKVDNVKKLNTAIPTSTTRQPFAPVSAQLPTSSSFEQHPSPLLNAPPPPPVLPKLDAYLKSPPMTPSASKQQATVVSTPSPSISGRSADFKIQQQTPQTPSTPRSAHPLRPSVERRDSDRRAEFGAVNPFDKSKEKPQQQQQPQTHRQDSLSFMRSPPVPPKKVSLPAPHVSHEQPTNPFPPAWGANIKPREPPKEAPPAFGRIPKKPGPVPHAVPPSPLALPKTKEHKKDKERKPRMKSDGTLETKEERKARKAAKKAHKEKVNAEKKMLEKKKLKEKEGRESKEKEKSFFEKEREQREKEREREKKLKKEMKEKEKGKLKEKEKKKKKKKHRQSSEDDSDVDDTYQKRVMKDQEIMKEQSADAQLANIIGTTMYDRVKRRSSGVDKNDSKKKALQALKDKNHPKKKRLLVSSDEEEEDSSAESDGKKTDSEGEQEEDHHKKLKQQSTSEKEHHLSSESDSEEEVPPKKTKIDKPKSSFLDSDIFGADSSEDELVKPPNERKPKTSASDESDHHHKKSQKVHIDYHSLFGSDSVDEKKEKKKSQSPAHQKQRKRLPSSTHEELQPKRSKRGSLSSEVSAEPKSREQSVKKDDEQVASGSEIPSLLQEMERPRLLTKAAMKVFESPSTSQQQQQLQLSEIDTEEDDSEEAGPQNLSSTSSDSESERSALSPSRSSTMHEETEHDDGRSTVATTEEASQEPLDCILPAPPQPPAAIISHSPPAVQYEPMFQEMVEEEPVRDLEGDLAAQALCDDDDQNYEQGPGAIFDDCIDPIPEYPSHAFTRADEAIIVDPNPVEISDDQILMESYAEEPIPEEEETPEEPTRHPGPLLQPPVPIQTSTPRANQENEFPSPTSLAAHAVAVKSPLSVAVDGPQPPAPARTPQLFSPVAMSTSNDGLTSPLRNNHTPLSVVHQSPLVSPGITAATPPLQMMRNADFTQNLMAHPQNVYHTRQQFENSHFYPNNNRMQQQMQQVPLQQMAPAHQSPPVPVHPHLNGLASSSVILEHRGLAAVPSPSHQHSGTSSLSSPGAPPSFGKKMPPVWKGRIIIKNAAEATVQMHYMFGQKEYLNTAMATLDKLEKDPSLRIGQRMKAEGDGLYRLLHRLQEMGTTCLCVPVGNNPEEVQQHARILKTEFADYFIKRGCAGVIPLEISPKSFLYVFPPNEFTDQFLQSASPDLFSRIQNKLTEQFSYLFVAIAPATED